MSNKKDDSSSPNTLNQLEFSLHVQDISTEMVDKKSFNETPSEKDNARIASNKSNNCPKLNGTFHKILVAFGLVLGIFIGTISETAVSTITEVIAQDFQSFGSLTWIAGGYILTVVAFTPLIGKLSDIFGRKPVELTAIGIFAIGSLGSALANSMIMFIVFRVIAGIGGGGLTSMGFIMVSDVIPIEKRPAYLGLVAMSFAISSIIGPIIGGLIAEVSWRIIFYLSLPFCLVLALLVIVVLDLPKSEGDIMAKIKRVDFLGSISLILTIVTFMLATNWGGKDYDWNSAPIIVLLVLMVVFLIVFLFIQYKIAVEPILPARVFVRNVILSNIANMCAGAINFVTVFYLPVYFQSVHNATPSESGYRLIPFLAATSFFCFLAGFLINIFKTIRGIMWVGGVVTVMGVCLVAFMRQYSTLAEQVIFVMITGSGTGLIFQLVIFICQLSVKTEDVAITTGFTSFTFNIGGVIGLSIVGSVYSNILFQQILAHLPNYSPHEILLPHVARTLSDENKEILKTCYLMAFRYGYICIIPFAIVCLISVLGISKVTIPKKQDIPAPVSQ